MMRNAIKHRSLIVAASLIGLAFPTSISLADVDTGVKKYQTGDFKGAVSEWGPLASKGDANAAFNLGQSYRLGRGVTQDINKAVAFYEQAAKNGHVAAQGNLGTLLYFSAAPVQNRKKAVEWWHTAAQNGDARAQYMLGVLYFNGDDVEKDWSKAYAYTSLAKDAGLKEADSSYTEMARHLPSADIEKGNAQKSKLIASRSALAGSTPPVLNDSGKDKPMVAWNTATTALPQGTMPATDAQVTAAALPTAAPPPSNLPTVYTGNAVANAEPAPPPPTQTVSAPLTGWRVQLGAFGTQGAAESAWTELQRQASGTLASKAPSFEPAGASTRLLVAGLPNRIAANSLCGKLKAQGVTCFIKAN
jgi:uncharacterized protein